MIQIEIQRLASGRVLVYAFRRDFTVRPSRVQEYARLTLDDLPPGRPVDVLRTALQELLAQL